MMRNIFSLTVFLACGAGCREHSQTTPPDGSAGAVPDSGASNGADTVPRVPVLGQLVFRHSVDLSVALSPRALAVGDLNGDHRPDMVVATSGNSGIAILLNEGAGRFSAPIFFAEFTGVSAAVIADLNGDQKPDIAVADTGRYETAVLLSTGDVTRPNVVRYPVGSAPISIASGDLDADGDQDLVVANSGDGTVSVLLNSGKGSFAAAVAYAAAVAPFSIALGDVDGDGNPDIVVANHSDAGGISVLLNLGPGVFGAPTNHPTAPKASSVTVGDVNGDGQADVIVVDNGPPGVDANNITVLLNEGGGLFPAAVRYAAGFGAYWVAIGDMNGDGSADIVTANHGADELSETVLARGDVSVLMNRGDGSFLSPVSYVAGVGVAGAAIADIDGDGYPDVAVANYNSHDVSLLFGMSDGMLEAEIKCPSETAGFVAAGGGLGYSVAAGDVNGDGRTDLVAVTGGAPNGGGAIRMFTAAVDGSFTVGSDILAEQTPRVPSNPQVVRLADMNGDGHLDMVIGDGATLVSQGWSDTAAGKGDGTFASVVTSFRAAEGRITLLSLGDVTGDGRVDVAIVMVPGVSTDARVRILANDADGALTPATTFTLSGSPIALGLEDLNGDGKAEMVALGNDGIAQVSVNNGDGTFATAVLYPTGLVAGALSIGDLDGDGDVDLVVAGDGKDGKGHVAVLWNDGNGALVVSQVYGAGGPGCSGMVIADLDGDGKADLALSKIDTTSNVTVLLNLGDNRFSEALSFGDAANPAHAIVAGDFNSDGKTDLAVVGPAREVDVLMNSSRR